MRRSLTSTANSGEREAADHVIEARCLRGDASGVALCFDLGEPNGRVDWPERW